MFRTKDRQKCDELFDRYYAGRKFCRTLYHEMIRRYISAGHRLLDAGCGRYLEFSKEFSNEVQVVGIDLEDTLETRNRRSPFGVRGDLSHLPFPDNFFDLIISRSVVEHLTDPGRVFREFHRVLKPGGKVILSTPNKYDYVSLIASVTPYRWHRSLVSRIFRVPADDVYPTFYRANTPSRISRQLMEAGLVQRELEVVNHYPAYLMFSPVLFRLGVLYERVTSLRKLEILRGTLLCAFEKSTTGARLAGPSQKQSDEVEVSSARV